jgi:hypothetical protein
MATPNDAVADALARAQAVSAEAATTSLPAAAASSVPAAPSTPPARPKSLQDALDQSGTEVDGWLGMKDGNFTVNKSKSSAERIKVTIKPSEVKFGYGVRFAGPQGQVYLKSYNGVTEARTGKNWSECVAQAQQNDPKCNGQYDLADIPMTLREEVSGGGKNPVTIPEGKRVGYTTAITGYGPFMAWLNQVMKDVGDANAVIPVELFKYEKTGGGYDYAVIGFETDESGSKKK